MEDDVTRNIEEQLSAFLDGELPEEELQLLVRRLDKEPLHRATLARYALSGSLLRNDPVLPSTAGFRERVMAHVDSAAEAPAQPDAPAVAAVASKSAGPGFTAGRFSVAAALLVGLAVVGVTQWAPVAPEAQIATTVDAPALVSKAQVVQRQLPVRQQRNRVRNKLNRDRFTSYMVSHGEFSRSFQGTMVDSRIFVQQASFED